MCKATGTVEMVSPAIKELYEADGDECIGLSEKELRTRIASAGAGTPSAAPAPAPAPAAPAPAAATATELQELEKTLRAEFEEERMAMKLAHAKEKATLGQGAPAAGPTTAAQVAAAPTADRAPAGTVQEQLAIDFKTALVSMHTAATAAAAAVAAAAAEAAAAAAAAATAAAATHKSALETALESMTTGATAAILQAEERAAAEAALALQNKLAGAANAQSKAEAASAKAAVDEAAAKEAMQALLDAEVARTVVADAGVQYGGKGDFKAAHLELTTGGQLTVKSLDTKRPEPLVEVNVAGCTIEQPKKPRKDFPHAVVLRKVSPLSPGGYTAARSRSQ